MNAVEVSDDFLIRASAQVLEGHFSPSYSLLLNLYTINFGFCPENRISTEFLTRLFY